MELIRLEKKKKKSTITEDLSAMMTRSTHDAKYRQLQSRHHFPSIIGFRQLERMNSTKEVDYSINSRIEERKRQHYHSCCCGSFDDE